MVRSKDYIAVDLGAESGRLMLGKFDGKKIVLEEKHRFTTGGTRLNNTIYWNAMNFFSEIKKGLQKCNKSEIAAIATGELSSVKQAREIVRNSLELIRYEPEQTSIWEEAYQKYKNHKHNGSGTPDPYIRRN